MNFPEKEMPGLHIDTCWRCGGIYKSPANGQARTLCGVIHGYGDCCHHGEQKVSAEALDRILKFVEDVTKE